MQQGAPAVAEKPASLGVADAAKALQLCLKGATGDGIALYVAAINSKNERGERPPVPVGLHLRFLESAGLNEAAATIRQKAVVIGLNVCAAAVMKLPPADIAAEYRALFERGHINSLMVIDYLIQLSKLNQTDEMKTFLDPDRLFRRTALTIGSGGDSGGRFWNSVAENLLQRQSGDNWQENVQSVRAMHYIDLRGQQDPLIGQVLDEIKLHIERFHADVRSTSQALWPWVPQAYRVAPWALISSGFGYNKPHIHHKGWMTGVLYVSGPDEIGPDGYPVGALRVGPPAGIENTAGWPDFAVAPKPGTLVLMPSYFTHWTIPLGKPGLRISIAFDVIDLRDDPVGAV